MTQTCTTRFNGMLTIFRGEWYADGGEYVFHLDAPLELGESMLNDIEYDDFLGDAEDLVIYGWWSSTFDHYTSTINSDEEYGDIPEDFDM